MGWTATLACHVGYRTILMSSAAVGSRLAGPAWLRRSRDLETATDEIDQFYSPAQGVVGGGVPSEGATLYCVIRGSSRYPYQDISSKPCTSRSLYTSSASGGAMLGLRYTVLYCIGRW